MNNPAAFSGSYCDMKFIKSRSVAQIVVEIPIEQAAAFIAAFGVPEPSKECPVAIARLDLSKTPTAPEKPKRAFNELPIAQRAALLCDREAFRTFMNQQMLCNVICAEDAASSLRGKLGIKSRSELATNQMAAARFRNIENEFELWLNEAL